MQLRVLRGSEPGRIYALTMDSLSIGREEGNDVCIPEPGVSRRHCALTNVGGEWMLEDNGSINGVLVNGRRISDRQFLHDGDEITIFSHTFKLECEPLRPVSEAEPLRPVPPSAPPVSPLPLTPLAGAAKPVPVAVPVPEPPPNPGELPKLGQGLPDPVPDYNQEEPVYSQDDSNPAAAGGSPLLIWAKLLMVLFVAGIAAVYFLMVRKPSGASPDGEAAEAVPVASSVSGSPSAVPEKMERGDALLGTAAAEAAVVGVPAVPSVPSVPASGAVREASPDLVLPPAERGSEPQGEPASVPPMLSGAGAGRVSVCVIETEPSGAEVTVDGEFRGVSPVLLRGLEPSKRYSVSVVKAGYERQMTLFRGDEGIPEGVMRLIPKAGTLIVTSRPSGAVVREGRRIYGTTPLAIPEMSGSEHELVLELPGYETVKKRVRLMASRGDTLEVVLEKQLGGLDVVTFPSGCEIHLDGLLLGVTQPGGDERGVSEEFRADNLLPGKGTLKIVHPETGQYETASVVIPANGVLTRKVTLWIPSHKVIMPDGKTAVGMEVKRSGDVFEMLTVQGTREQYAALGGDVPDGVIACREILPITAEDRALILKNLSETHRPSEQMSTKSKLSITADDFQARARYVSFQGYIRQTLCITGRVTSRMKTPRGTWIRFGKQIQCVMAPSATDEDYKKIGELSRQGQPVSLRGVYEGPDKDDMYLFTECVLLPYPD